MNAEPSSRVLLASSDELLVVQADEPGKAQVIARHATPIPCDRALIWAGHAVVGGPKGFATVDLKTGAARHFCSTPLGSRWAYAIASGAVFFNGGEYSAHLMTAPIPEAGSRSGGCEASNP
jgi:hypothetical protein